MGATQNALTLLDATAVLLCFAAVAFLGSRRKAGMGSKVETAFIKANSS
jgi:hypothetical protein